MRRGAGESGTGPPEAGAEQPRRRAPPLAERSRGLARGADVLVLAGTWKGFFFHNLLVGLGLGYAKPYPCSPLATPGGDEVRIGVPGGDGAECHDGAPRAVSVNVAVELE